MFYAPSHPVRKGSAGALLKQNFQQRHAGAYKTGPQTACSTHDRSRCHEKHCHEEHTIRGRCTSALQYGSYKDSHVESGTHLARIAMLSKNAMAVARHIGGGMRESSRVVWCSRPSLLHVSCGVQSSNVPARTPLLGAVKARSGATCCCCG